MKQDDIHTRLALSLDQANRKRKTPAATPEPTPARQCSKLSISLYPADLARVKAIQSFMLQQYGETVSRSQAIKLALRATPINETLAKLLGDIRKEDGRAKW